MEHARCEPQYLYTHFYRDCRGFVSRFDEVYFLKTRFSDGLGRTDCERRRNVMYTERIKTEVNERASKKEIDR